VRQRLGNQLACLGHVGGDGGGKPAPCIVKRNSSAMLGSSSTIRM
jgi:hypothetical protein